MINASLGEFYIDMEQIFIPLHLSDQEYQLDKNVSIKIVQLASSGGIYRKLRRFLKQEDILDSARPFKLWHMRLQALVFFIAAK